MCGSSLEQYQRWCCGSVPHGGSVMRKPTTASPGEQEKEPDNLAAVETRLFHEYPGLMGALVTIRYSNGEPREPGMVMIRVQGTTFQVILKDPSTKKELPAVGQTIDDAFAALELMLGMERPPWSRDRFAEEREARKPRK